MSKPIHISDVTDKNKLSLFVNNPEKECIDCGKKYRIPEELFVQGKGYPRIYTPRCPECQKKMDEFVKEYKIEHSADKVKKEFSFRVNNTTKYLKQIGIPYPNHTNPYGRLDDIKNLAREILNNKWIILSGNPGTGKTYLLSLAFRLLATTKELYKKTLLYRSITYIVSDIKKGWDENGFNTGEELIRECGNAGVLGLEVNDAATNQRTSSFRNETLFKIVDERYVRMKKGMFAPTVFIIVMSPRKSLHQTLADQGIDESVIGRIIELGADNMYKFKDSDFRKTKALEIKKIRTIE